MCQFALAESDKSCYSCIYICIYLLVFYAYTDIYIYIYIYTTSTSIYLYIQSCMYMDILHVHIYIYMYACLYLYQHPYMYLCLEVQDSNNWTRTVVITHFKNNCRGHRRVIRAVWSGCNRPATPSRGPTVPISLGLEVLLFTLSPRSMLCTRSALNLHFLDPKALSRSHKPQSQ